MCRKLAKSALSGIKDISVDGLNLIINTTDNKQLIMTFPKPADGLNGIDGIDGRSIINVEINENNHLICTMSDLTTIDAGEIKGINNRGGGLVQENSIGDFPQVGEEGLLYLTKEDNILYYWNGIAYTKIAASGSGDCECPNLIYATEEDIDDLFNKEPIDIDYATKEDIDNLFGGKFVNQYATEEDIDSLFNK